LRQTNIQKTGEEIRTAKHRGEEGREEGKERKKGRKGRREGKEEGKERRREGMWIADCGLRIILPYALRITHYVSRKNGKSLVTSLFLKAQKMGG